MLSFKKTSDKSYRLREFPSSPDVYYVMYNVITVIMDKGQRACLIGNSKCKLIDKSYRLREFPSSPDVYYVMYNVITVIMDKGQGACLIGNSKRKLIVVHQTHLKTK